MRSLWQIWGSTTDIGKTIFSTAIISAAPKNSTYIKPIQTGFPIDSDANFVFKFTNKTVLSLLNYKLPISPHAAAKKENNIINDIEIISKTRNSIISSKSPFILLETAGGINSPTPSGSLQSDLYRALRLPSILVGDSRLGGISTTISAFESLKIRGYDVPVVLMFEDLDYDNGGFLKSLWKDQVDVFVFKKPPLKVSDTLDLQNLKKYFSEISPISKQIVSALLNHSQKRQNKLVSMHTSDKIWWPFTQHDLVSSPTVIDSAYKDHFTVFDNNDIESDNGFKDLFDASASWWTQGLGHGNSKLALAAASAAGRYGHVMSAECIHEPASDLVDILLETAGKGWADRVFFSDNGSTAMEVAVKMALTYFSKQKVVNKKVEWSVIGIEGSYHGDTIGAMDLSDPSIYNERVHWYQGKGQWISPPSYIFQNGSYKIRLPDFVQDILQNETSTFSNLDNLFCPLRLTTDPLAKIYQSYIETKLPPNSPITKTAACLVLEPLILGAGGMKFIDPLFQIILITHCKKKLKIPVIFDEVFVGMYRLGQPSTLSLLNKLDKTVKPDIACYAKMLTGGVLPLAVTLATKSVFNAFRGQKVDALLHGHSYTAHPVGCAIAVESIKEYQMLNGGSGDHAVTDSMWGNAMERFDGHFMVEGMNLLGSVFILELKDDQTKGYLSGVSKVFVKELKRHGVFCRPLGNVVYFMASMNSRREELDNILDIISKSLDVFKKAVLEIKIKINK